MTKAQKIEETISNNLGLIILLIGLAGFLYSIWSLFYENLTKGEVTQTIIAIYICLFILALGGWLHSKIN